MSIITVQWMRAVLTRYNNQPVSAASHACLLPLNSPSVIEGRKKRISFCLPTCCPLRIRKRLVHTDSLHNAHFVMPVLTTAMACIAARRAEESGTCKRLASRTSSLFKTSFNPLSTFGLFNAGSLYGMKSL
ncbi:hypothetical protein [Pantoea agglomerans]|uniref:hypothetical protein n=1 Tax=Enterobacter agglomerans TaxID=549 RepID=UPI0013792EE7|nr:hypothetical protein [Pantoea agglomerans]